MKFNKAIIALLACGLTVGSAFATLTPTWAIDYSADKLVPYPHACNLTTQSATTDVYGYFFSGQGGTNPGLVITDYSPSTGSITWSKTDGDNYSGSMLTPGDLDADGTGGYVLYTERTDAHDSDHVLLHLANVNSSGLAWDETCESGSSPTGLGGYGASPLIVRVDDKYVFTVVYASGAPLAAVWNKSTGAQLATCSLGSGYTITSGYLQRELEISPNLSASFLLLADYTSSGVGMAKVTYDGTTLSATYSSQYKPSPPGITTTSLSSQTPATDWGIDCSGSYAYLVGTSTYSLPAYTYVQRTWGFNLAFVVSGTTPTYDTWVGNASGDDPTYESAAPTVCTQKCNGTYAGYDIFAENMTWFPNDVADSPSSYSWYPEEGGNIYTEQTAFPYSVLQCAAYYKSSIPESVAWYAGSGGIIKYTSTTNNPLTGSNDTFTDTSAVSLQDMEEGGSGEVYVAMLGTTYGMYRFSM